MSDPPPEPVVLPEVVGARSPNAGPGLGPVCLCGTPITDHMHEHLMAHLDPLMMTPEDKLSAEEKALMRVLGMVIEEYEKKRWPIGEGADLEAL